MIADFFFIRNWPEWNEFVWNRYVNEMGICRDSAADEWLARAIIICCRDKSLFMASFFLHKVCVNWLADLFCYRHNMVVCLPASTDSKDYFFVFFSLAFQAKLVRSCNTRLHFTIKVPKGMLLFIQFRFMAPRAKTDELGNICMHPPYFVLWYDSSYQLIPDIKGDHIRLDAPCI